MAGTFTVQQNLELLGRYRYAEMQFRELMGSWAYTMVDPERRKRVMAYPDQVLADQHPVGVYFKETKNA
jgi:hypothetical protein